jgi:hypothetical protein
MPTPAASGVGVLAIPEASARGVEAHAHDGRSRR